MLSTEEEILLMSQRGETHSPWDSFVKTFPILTVITWILSTLFVQLDCEENTEWLLIRCTILSLINALLTGVQIIVLTFISKVGPTKYLFFLSILFTLSTLVYLSLLILTANFHPWYKEHKREQPLFLATLIILSLGLISHLGMLLITLVQIRKAPYVEIEMTTILNSQSQD